MNWHLWHFLPYHLRALLSFVIVDHWSLIWFDDFKIAQSAEKRAAAGPWQLHPDWQTFTTYSNISVRIISLIHDHSMHIWVSHSFTFLRFEEPRLHLLIGTHPWPTEDLSDSLCPTALLSPVSRAHQQCIICTIGFIIHTHTYIYILSVLSNIHAFVATCRFSWPQQYKYFLARDESWGFFNLPSRGWRLNVASQALLRNASLRQKASEQGDDDGTDGIPNFGGSAWATNENSWGHLSRATNLYWIS